MSADHNNHSLDDLIESWKTAPQPSTKISSYFPIYVQLFQHLRGKPCVFIETGILDGGSLFMWRRWLGDQARIIGIDLNPQAQKWRNSGFEIHIGDQGDPLFWRHVFSKIGPFDALLDDGGHQPFQQMVTLSEALRFAAKPCVIAIEDTFSSFMADFGCPSQNSFLEYAKDATDCLVGRSFDTYPNRFPDSRNDDSIQLFRNVFNIQFFDGIACFHVNPNLILKSEVVRNRESTGASDFRYKGKISADVEWPNVLRADHRLVSSAMGGRHWRSLILKALRNPKQSLLEGSRRILRWGRLTKA